MSTTTTILSEKTVDKLKDLIQVNHDSTKGFEKAAELCEDPTLKASLLQYARQRTTFANELASHVPKNARDTDGSFAGKMHRWWMTLREKVTTDQRYNLLAEIERGEDKIVEMYQEVLVETAGSPVNNVLMSQIAQVKQVHDRVRLLRDGAKANK